MGKDVMYANASQIEFSTRPYDWFLRLISTKACNLWEYLAADAAESSPRKSMVSLMLRQTMNNNSD